MAVRKLTERKDFDSRDFFTDVKFYVNGKLIPFDGCTVESDVAHVLSGVCRKVNGFEDWIREYMNSLGDPIDPDGRMDTDELCYWFAKEMSMDFDDSYDDGFYLDGSGIVDGDYGVRVEAFEEDDVNESKTRRAKRRSVKEASAVKSAKRSRKSRVNEDYVDDFDGYPGIADVKRYLQVAADNADDLHFYLDNALRALDDNYMEMFSGSDDAYAVAETLERIGKAISDLQSQLPDEIINAPDAGPDYR